MSMIRNSVYKLNIRKCSKTHDLLTILYIHDTHFCIVWSFKNSMPFVIFFLSIYCMYNKAWIKVCLHNIKINRSFNIFFNQLLSLINQLFDEKYLVLCLSQHYNFYLYIPHFSLLKETKINLNKKKFMRHKKLETYSYFSWVGIKI